MFKVYLDYWGRMVANSIGSLIVSVLILGLIPCVIFVYKYESSNYGEEPSAKKFTIFVIVSSLILWLFSNSFTILTTLGTREYKADIQELKVSYGLEDYYLVIRNKDNDIIFEKTGYFEYTKEYNQITIYDKVTKSKEIISLDDDMEIKLNIKEGK